MYLAHSTTSNEPHREQVEPELVGGFESSRVLLFSVHLDLICSEALDLAHHLVPDEGGKKRDVCVCVGVGWGEAFLEYCSQQYA